MNIKITADSTCDLSPELCEKYGVTMLPLYIVKDGKSYKDMVEITPTDIFNHVATGGAITSTAAINVDDYINYFKPLSDSNDGVIHIDISAEFSSCHQNARIAAQDFDNVYVVDSRNLSTGSGLVVLKAAEYIEAGLSAKEVADKLNQLVAKVEASFVINKLDYLRKGGRCSALAALGANLLSLKPCIEVKDGKMSVGKKYRGNFDACIEKYVTERIEGREDIDKSRIFITHTGCDRGIVESVRKKLTGYGFEEILETIAGCTVSSHCGPNTLGVLFIRK